MKISTLIPRSIKAAFRTPASRILMRQALRDFDALPDAQVPPSMIKQFLEAWGEDGFRATAGYLNAVCKYANETEGPILEIGSGLSTILLGAISRKRGIRTWSFEHSSEFYHHTAKWLMNLKLQTRLFHAPLKQYEDFDWYGPDFSVVYDSGFKLVIADGPPGSTKGGRYGLLPVMRWRISDEAVILLDDAQRPEEQETLNRWQQEFGLEYRLETVNEQAWAVCHFTGSHNR